MNFNELLNSGIIVSISITILVAGLIVFYFNSRFIALENQISRQQQVLSTFVANMRNDIQPMMATQTSGPISEDATPEAQEAAERFSNQPQDKIAISDDSEEEDDTDDDTEDDNSIVNNSGSDNDERETSTNDVIEVIDSELETVDNGVKIIELSKNSPDQTDDINNSADDADDEEEDDEDDDEEINQDDDDTLEDLDVEHIPETPSPAISKLQNNIQYKKLNVATLRTLVVEKELATKGEAAKINKKDLTNMLENNN